jgi:hypothetical protein
MNIPNPVWPRGLSLALLLSLVALSPAAAGLEVSVEYRGPGDVSEKHPILVLLFESPEFEDQPVALQTLGSNGGSVQFEDLPVTEVYLMALYDTQGGFAATGAPPMTSPVGIHRGADGEPLVLQAGDSVRFQFDDKVLLSHLAFGSEDDEKLTSAEGIIEIRMYRIKPGMRDRFVEFFEGKTLAPQSEVGMRILGQFRSLEDDDTFVWVRAFRNQEERLKQLTAFYGGPIWMESLGPEAMGFIESTEVLLVEPTGKSPMR